MNKLLYIICSAALLMSCSDLDVLDELEPSMSSSRSRVSTVTTSPTFDWESSSSISLVNVNENVILPWYSGAIANIPAQLQISVAYFCSIGLYFLV